MSVVSLYLASRSPRRRELLNQIGVRFSVIAGDINETPEAQESPEIYVVRMAREKAAAGSALVSLRQVERLPVLAADTSVVMDGHILGKPVDQAEAAKMLGLLSDHTHQVMTAVAVTNGERIESRLSVSQVVFNALSDREIERYWHTDEPQDKAGAYGVQGFGAVFVRELQGSYSGVVGLPIVETVALLNDFGVPYWQ